MTTVLDLNDIINLARELNVLGDYEKAPTKYNLALKLTTDRKSKVSNSSLKEKWSQVEIIIKNEISMTEEALKIAKTFQNNDQTRFERAKQEEEKRYNKLLQRNLDPPKKIENKNNIKPKQDIKDPKNKPKPVNPGKNIKVEKGGKGPGGKPTGKKGEDEKKDPKSGKSPFFLHHYPQGEGPDAELIEMVEREVMEKNPNVKFDDIAELEGAKSTLKEAVLLPLLMPDYFRGIRRPWKGVLLYGPPGTGKTLLAKALATQGKTTFFNVSPTTFASKWKGESEKLVRILFEMARFYAPSTIFIDEVDSIGQKRGDGDNEASRKVMAEMLVQMDGVSGKLDREDLSTDELKKNIVMVMGATNLPWDLDDALRRRFEKRVYIPLPNSVGRKQMFKINLRGMKLDKNIDLDELVEKTKGYSGADIANVCREASLINMREVFQRGKLNFTMIKQNASFLMTQLDAPITQDNLREAVKNIGPSVGKEDIKKFEQFTEEYASN